MSVGSIIFGHIVPSFIISQKFAIGRDLFRRNIILDLGFNGLFLIS